jgi:hypothetical protein
MAYVFRGGWIANLSNGETVFETELNPSDHITPWQALLSRCREEGIKITALRIRRDNFSIYTMPQALCDGYYQAYEVTDTMRSHQQTVKQGIGSVVGDKVYITWLNFETFEIFQEIRDLASSMKHVTL